MEGCEQTSVNVINYTIVGVITVILVWLLAIVEKLENYNKGGTDMDFRINMIKKVSYGILPFIVLTVLSTMYLQTKICGYTQYVLIILPFLMIGIQDYINKLFKKDEVVISGKAFVQEDAIQSE